MCVVCGRQLSPLLIIILFLVWCKRCLLPRVKITKLHNQAQFLTFFTNMQRIPTSSSLAAKDLGGFLAVTQKIFRGEYERLACAGRERAHAIRPEPCPPRAAKTDSAPDRFLGLASCSQRVCFANREYRLSQCVWQMWKVMA